MDVQAADAPTMSMPAAPAMRQRMRDAGRVAVVGASGRSGAAICRALHVAGQSFVPLVHDAGRWDLAGLEVAPRVTELSDRRTLAAALADAATVVNCAHASWNAALIDAAPRDATFILMGSSRRFSCWPDTHGDGVRAGPDEIRRLTEDKAFDTAPMRDLLGIVPVALGDGLAMTFGGGRRAA